MESRASLVVTPPRNGACMVPKGAALDVRFLAAMNDGVQAAALDQDAGGEEIDDVEFHDVQGPFDWRAYIGREMRSMRARRGAFP